MNGVIRNLLRFLGLRPSGNSSTAVSTSRRVKRAETKETVVAEWLAASPYCDASESAEKFYHAAFKCGHVNANELRKSGVPLSLEEKRTLGLKTRAIITREFWDTLTELGKADPVDTAWKIVGPINQRLYNLESLSSMPEGMKAHFMASNMAAGPCAHAATLDGAEIKAEQAPIAPFDDCPHPDQCGCIYTAVVDWDVFT